MTRTGRIEPPAQATVSASRKGPKGSLGMLLERPDGALARTRWALLMATLAMAVVAGIYALFHHSVPVKIAALAAVIWFCSRRLREYARGWVTPRLELLEGLALALVGIAAINPANAMGIFYTGFMFRSLYSSRRRLIAISVLYLSAYGVAKEFSPAGFELLQFLTEIGFGLMAMAVVMYMLTNSLMREEIGAVRQAILNDAALALTAAVDRDHIYQTAVDAAYALATEGGGLYALVAIPSVGGTMAVAAEAGDRHDLEIPFARLASLTDVAFRAGGTLITERGSEFAEEVSDLAATQGATAIGALQIGGEIQGALVLVAGSSLPAELYGSFSGLTSQVSLALDRVALLERERDKRLDALIQHSMDIITLLDSDGIATYYSAAVDRVLGFEPNHLLGKTFSQLIHPQDRARASDFLERLMANPGMSREIEFRLRHLDGSWRHCDVTGTNLLADPQVNGCLLNIRDVSERVALQQQLVHKAFHDPLTAMPNRILFRDRLEHALARRQRSSAPLALLFIDLDDFKSINDSLGHSSGDSVLISVGERILASLRGSDTAARLGGDEFGVLLEDVAGPEEARDIARRILAALAQPLEVGDEPLQVDASIGIALAGEADSYETLLQNADVAMYLAKKEGKHRLRMFDATMHAELVERLALRHELERALPDEQLILHYQPIVSMDTLMTEGVEALVRWSHPDRGMISPADFIPLAEESGLIVDIGRWVLNEACAQAKKWHDMWPNDPPLRMSVNLSARQLQEESLVADISDALARSELQPSSLTLEITESTAMEGPKQSAAQLHAIKALGVRLAIDDFGTGYSSLGRLRDLPVDAVKIDKTFIDEVTKGPENSAIARAIMKLADTLDLVTVAEGIEDAEQLAFLQSLGCRQGQGYYFARPAAAADIEVYMRNQRHSLLNL